jgi:hypothetical protein
MSTPNDESLPELPWREPPAPRAEISEAIRKQCTGELCARRGMSSTSRVVLSLLLSGGVLALIMFLGSGHDRPEGAVRAALFGAAGWALVQVVVLVVGLAQPPGKRISSRARLLLAIALPVLFLGYLAFAAQNRLPVGEFMSHGNAGYAVGCGLHALLFSAIAAGGTLFVWRGTDPLTPGLSGALAGLVGGLGGAVAIGVVCPSGETWHLWIGHGVAVIALMLVGWFVGRRWLTP